jgi:hypothetical protein
MFVRSDNSRGEFGAMFQEALLQKGVQFEPSLLYKHLLNSVIKRAIRKINTIIRLLLYQAKLYYLMWDYAVKHAVWLKNRLPTSALPYKAYFDATTLFQAYKEHKPDLKSLRIFGCAAHPINIHRPSLTYDPKILD